MRTNKKVFWFSVIVLLLSIFAIIMFTIYKCNRICEVFLNIFISLAGGAFISGVTAFIAFHQLSKDYQIKFNSNVNSLNNILLDMLNWYQWYYKKVNYHPDIDVEKWDNIRKMYETVYGQSDKHVREFAQLVIAYRDFNYDEMIYILDDYRVIFRNKTNKVKKLMIELRNELNKYNIAFYDDMKITISLYEMRNLPEAEVFDTIVDGLDTKTNIRNEKLQELLSLRQKYLKATNLSEYTKKQQ